MTGVQTCALPIFKPGELVKTTEAPEAQDLTAEAVGARFDEPAKPAPRPSPPKGGEPPKEKPSPSPPPPPSPPKDAEPPQ